MSPRACRALVLVAATACASPPPPRAADQLPPERPTTPYRAEIRNSFSISRPGGGRSGGDTFEIRVSGTRLFEDPQLLDEMSVIVDTEQRSVLEFDPDSPEKVAARSELNDMPIPYVAGRAALEAYDPSWGPPRIAGQDEVAKRGCTVLHFGNPEQDGAAACVSDEGVVLRARIVWPGYEREFEVLDLDPGEQGEQFFQLPEGFHVVEGG